MNLFHRASNKGNGSSRRYPKRLIGMVAGITALGGVIATVSTEAAFASAPTSATFTPGSTSANATSTWTVALTTSATGALSASNSISVSLNPSFIATSGQSVTFTGFGLTCPAATDFVAGNVVTIALPAGCSLANSSSGTLSIPAITNPAAGTYTNTTFSVATSQDTNAVTNASNIVITAAASTSSATALTVNPNPVPPVGPVTLTAAVTPSTATGTIAFYNNGALITGCTAVTLASGSANCATSYSSTGNTTYVAVYSGNSTLTGSTSATLVPTAQALTRTSIELRKGSDPYGLETRQRITVQVSTVLGTSAAISGTVQAMAGSQVLCTITLVSNHGQCGLTAKELAGHHTYRIYAAYSGATSFAKSTADNQLYRIIGG